MSYLASLVMLAFLLLIPQTLRGVYFQAYKPPVEAKAGYVATGILIRQDAKNLLLNTEPCSNEREKQVVIFHAPFSTKAAADASCPGGSRFPQITVTQG